jgi:hypothetical protein
MTRETVKWNASLASVPDWIVLVLAVCSLITGGATAAGLMWKGLQWIGQGFRAFLKPWTDHPRQLQALQEHDAAEELCKNHREPSIPEKD